MVFVCLGGEGGKQRNCGYSRVVRFNVFAHGGHGHPSQQAVPQDECVAGQAHGRGESGVGLFLIGFISVSESQNVKLGFRNLLLAKSLIKLSSDLRGCWFRDN